MPEVKVIKILFNTPLKPIEIPAFRGAVINVVGRDKIAFHNHLMDEKFKYSYPVIQYKMQDKKAGIVCINEGVDDIHHFIQKNEGRIYLGKSQRDILVERVEINRVIVEVTDKTFKYQLKKWLPLNEKNYKVYQQLDGVKERMIFLERIITGNILSFAKGINWTVEEPIRVDILNLPHAEWVSHKGTKLQAFDVDFKANVNLPNDIGLGKAASTGFGTLSKN